MRAQHGFLVVDKPAGITSHDVVAQVRRRFNTKRVGHAGTLDPMATGVLVIGINNATKFLQYVMEGKKRYLATIRLGISTTTDDKEGEVLEVKEISDLSDSKITEALSRFTGVISQVPSKVSAVKIKGKRAYSLARSGENFEIPAREITVYELKVVAIKRGENLEVDIDVTCSAGTYIRAIARDLGVILKVGGHLTQLRRIAAYPFEIGSAGDIETVPLTPLFDAISQLMPVRTLNEAEIVNLKFGRQISSSPFEGAGVAIDGGREVVAIIKNIETGCQPVTVFNP